MDYTFYGSNGDPSLRSEIQPYLHPDEELLWIDKPCRSRKPRPNLFAGVFIIFWLGFAIFWTALATSAGGLFGLFGLPFVAFGCVFAYITFFGNRNRMERTTYAVTNKRALILIHGTRGTNCTEFAFSKLESISMSHVQGNTGTIHIIPHRLYYDGHYNGRYSRRYTVGYDSSQSQETSFLYIDNVQAVYRLISERITAE